ncbi:LysR family transcriptional regulator, partial [Vibrio sp. DBSS07]|nr:LysR family transcriptional regulator [Vibrio paucivorans]
QQDQTHSFSAPIQRIYDDFMLTRQPQLRSSQTQILLERMCESDAVLFGTNTIQALTGFNRDFRLIHSLEHDSRYTVQMHLLQHERTLSSQAHQWFTKLLVDHFRRAIGTTLSE